MDLRWACEGRDQGSRSHTGASTEQRVRRTAGIDVGESRGSPGGAARAERSPVFFGKGRFRVARNDRRQPVAEPNTRRGQRSAIPVTRRYVVVGNPVGHSLSPRIHELFAEQTGIDLVYEPLLAPLDGFVRYIGAFFESGGSGVNVTLPFKEAAFDWVTSCDE